MGEVYISTKIVKAAPMAAAGASKRLGREVSPANPGAAGYLIKYPDGYESWCPWEEFHRTYREMSEAERNLAASLGRWWDD